ncbi:unnamed protein product, partial [marine sediment metagenome]
MNAMKEFADETSQDIVFYKVTNPKFYDKFDWLTEKNEGTFEYFSEDKSNRKNPLDFRQEFEIKHSVWNAPEQQQYSSK